MEEIFKTLEFTDETKELEEKYAHPIEIGDHYEWAGSPLPMLVTSKATIPEMKELYKGLNFDCVKLVSKKLIDIE